MTATAMIDRWADVAAPGTDAGRLRRVVAALVDVGYRLSRDLARAGLHGGGLLAPSDDTASILDGLAAHAVAPPDEVAAVAAAWQDLGVRAALLGDPAYPPRLERRWPGLAAPALLAWRGGATGCWDRPAVAIVGARRATGYGSGIAAWLAETLARAGVVVVSGGAVGVDAAAHEGALAAGGVTAVVLGCGHGARYPRVHATAGGLFDRVLAAGGYVVSEHRPGTGPTPAHVLSRNRIVAGLADALVVVEGSARSGSLRTAEVAADAGVPVLAVPGDVRAPGSVAPHRLLADGAAPCTSPADVLAVLDPGSVADDDPRVVTAGGVSALPDAVRLELERRWPRPVRVDELARATGTAAGTLLAALTRARIAGELAEGVEGVRLTRHPDAPRTRRTGGG